MASGYFAASRRATAWAVWPFTPCLLITVVSGDPCVQERGDVRAYPRRSWRWADE